MLMIICSLLSAQQLYNSGSSFSDKPSFGTYAAEFGGALLGTSGCVGLAGGTYLLTLILIGEDIERGNHRNALLDFATGSLVVITVLAGTPASTAYGVQKVGEKLNQDGSFWVSFGGSLGGIIIGAGIGYGISRINPEKINIAYTMIPTTLLGHWFGAVIGYNLRKSGGGDFGLHNPQFGLPSVGLRTEKIEEGKTITAVDFRLINARF